MILGNDPAGFSCGEVYAYFHPFRAHHVLPYCGCADPDCDLWPQVKRNGLERIYETIFELKPEVQFIVDSSKDPFWIDSQRKYLDQQGIASRHILIWKSPAELAQSYKKRDMVGQWERSWIVYHRLYYALIDHWRAVRYADFVQNEDALPEICAYLDIPYFDGKERFWEKEHHLLFGNASARIHLQEENIEMDSALGDGLEAQRQQIYYQPVTDPEILAVIKERKVQSPLINQICNLLESRDIFLPDQRAVEFPEVKMNPAAVQLRRIKQQLMYARGAWRFRA